MKGRPGDPVLAEPPLQKVVVRRAQCRESPAPPVLSSRSDAAMETGRTSEDSLTPSLVVIHLSPRCIRHLFDDSLQA